MASYAALLDLVGEGGHHAPGLQTRALLKYVIVYYVIVFIRSSMSGLEVLPVQLQSKSYSP